MIHAQHARNVRQFYAVTCRHRVGNYVAPCSCLNVSIKHLLSLSQTQRQYYREFKKVTEASDVCLEVLDARDPMGCRCLEAERLIRSQGKDKRIILVLNKIDLVPKAVVLQWLKRLRNEYPTIAFKASTQHQKSNLGRNDRMDATKASDASRNRHECLGGETLIQLLKNYSRSLNLKTSISVRNFD